MEPPPLTKVSRLKRKLSKVFVAGQDRIRFVLSDLPEIFVSFFTELRAARTVSAACLKIEILEIDWGRRRVLVFTDAFKLSCRNVPSLPHPEVEAFWKGEPAISDFFSEAPQNESERRAKMPELMRANPEDFVIIVSPQGDGSFRVVDGAHRLAIAKKTGLSEIWARIGWVRGQQTNFHTNPRLFWSWLLLPFKK